MIHLSIASDPSRVFAEYEAPNSKHTIKVENIDRTEPDASLFQVPADYHDARDPEQAAKMSRIKYRIEIE